MRDDCGKSMEKRVRHLILVTRHDVCSMSVSVWNLHTVATIFVHYAFLLMREFFENPYWFEIWCMCADLTLWTRWKSPLSSSSFLPHLYFSFEVPLDSHRTVPLQKPLFSWSSRRVSRRWLFDLDILVLTTTECISELPVRRHLLQGGPCTFVLGKLVETWLELTRTLSLLSSTELTWMK